MSLKDELEIFLITFNRKQLLDKTFSQILADDSPIRNLDITVLNNKSDDGTTELIEEYRKQFPNIKHVVHKHNIGGNANIIRAFEQASKKYVWVLCDDDEYDWSNWKEIQDVIKLGYDAIMVHIMHFKFHGKFEKNADFAPIYVNLSGFLSGTIYKTSNITDDVFTNMYHNIYNCFPHLMIVIHLINTSKNIYICSHNCVIQGWEQKTRDQFTRGIKFVHFRIASFNLFAGYVNSFQHIQDKSLRYKCCQNLLLEKSFFYSIDAMFEHFNYSKYELFDIFAGVNSKLKIIFIAACMKHYIKIQIKRAIKFSKLVLQQIFSIKNKGNYKVVRMLGIAVLKIKRK
ncbi:hypothetical protein FACS189449_07060 [Alphaproteobacteria bacterium]|nr:hypothetical protein FACS189449_07060 [Alphaproteobacteria bacterium]